MIKSNYGHSANFEWQQHASWPGSCEFRDMIETSLVLVHKINQPSLIVCP